jgi:hypothetical protein
VGALLGSACDDDGDDVDRDGAVDELDGSTGDAGGDAATVEDASGSDTDASTADASSQDGGGDAGVDAAADDDASTGACEDDCPPLLTALALSAGTLEPALDDVATDYALTVGLTTQTITLTPSASEGATIEIAGQDVASGTDWQSGLLALGPNEITVTVSADDYPDRVYMLTVTRAASLAYVKAGNAEGDDALASVAISGDTLVAGAPGEDSNATTVDGDGANDDAAASGAAYVFVRSGGAWTQQAYLKAENNNAGDAFGSSVAISGDTVVVGAPDEDSNATTVDGDGANDDAAESGAAYVFVRSGISWTQQAYLKASNAGAGDAFGTSVAVSADTIVVGANLEDSNATTIGGDGANDDAAESGAAYVFLRDGTSWSEQAYLKASNAEAGDGFGGTVAISGDTVAVGASLEDSGALGVDGDQGNDAAEDSGAAYVFERSGTTWSQQAYVKATNTDAFDVFGISVAIDGNTLVVGASLEDSNATTVGGSGANDDAMDSGAAYVYRRTGNSWNDQAYLKAANAGAGDTFGFSVAISGDAVVIGARLEDGSATVVDGVDDDAAQDSGAAYLFLREGTAWTQQGYLKASNAAMFDNFGECVAISGNTIAVGAPGEDSSSAATPADNSANESGAVYAF